MDHRSANAFFIRNYSRDQGAQDFWEYQNVPLGIIIESSRDILREHSPNTPSGIVHIPNLSTNPTATTYISRYKFRSNWEELQKTPKLEQIYSVRGHELMYRAFLTSKNFLVSRFLQTSTYTLD